MAGGPPPLIYARVCYSAVVPMCVDQGTMVHMLTITM